MACFGSFELVFYVILITSLNMFSYNNVILLVLLKKIRIFIIFVILLLLIWKDVEFVTFESHKYLYLQF